jgi:ADP-heptose:LPS heptosyltransferase
MDTHQASSGQIASAPQQSRRHYSYRRKLPRLLASAFDCWGPILFRRHKKSRPAAFNRIAVIRVDQIGDAVLALPYLSALKTRYPESQISFITSSAGQAMLKGMADLCEIRVFDAPWFAGDRGILQAMRDLRILLKEIQPDAVVDLRGDIRHLWSARQALPKAWIEGYGITGGGFLADYSPEYSALEHAALKNFAFMDVPLPLEPLQIPSTLAGQPLTRRVSDMLPAAGERPWIAFHIGAGADSKRWSETHWKQLAERVSTETDAQIIWIGDRDADDRSRIILSLLNPSLRSRSTILCHALGLGELNTLLARCKALVTHDSGPAHIAAAIQLPTLILFSGANRVDEWRPLNSNAVILSEPVACSPCALKACSQKTHLCMEAITPDMAMARLKEMMR